MSHEISEKRNVIGRRCQKRAVSWERGVRKARCHRNEMTREKDGERERERSHRKETPLEGDGEMP